MQNMKEWQERCTDQAVCWMVLRLHQCKIVWLALEGKITTSVEHGVVHWQKRQENAVCWSEREEAYQQARSCGGLLYRYDRQEAA